MANIKNITLGALLGTLASSIALLYPKRGELMDAFKDQTHDIADKARDYANEMMYKTRLVKPQNNNSLGYIAGGIAGMALGIGLALSYAPKTGKQLRTQLSKAYRELFGKTQEAIESLAHTRHISRNSTHKNGTHPLSRLAVNTRRKKRAIKPKQS